VAHFTNTVCLAYRILVVIKAVEARANTQNDSPVSPELLAEYLKQDDNTAEVSLTGWRAPSRTGKLAQLAWEVHHESSESYLQMSHSLFAGSKATSLQLPEGADCRDLTFVSHNLGQLQTLLCLLSPRKLSDIVWKARHRRRLMQ
jgi:hypothetical protein